MAGVIFFGKQSLLRRWSHLFLSMAVLLAAIPIRSQDKKGQTRTNEDDLIKISSNLVSVDVMVKDKKGKPVTDLKSEDFTISENGVLQKLEFFDSTLSSDAPPAANGNISLTSENRHPSNIPRNIIALVLDGQTTEGANLKHVRDGLSKYIRERVTDGDSVALFAISGGLRLLQPFTDEKAKLLAAVDHADGLSTGSKTSEQRSLNESIATIRDQLAAGPTGAITTPAGGSAAAQAMISQRILEQYLQMRSVLSTQQTRPILAGLAAICEGLRPIRGKKTLVVFSQGFIAPQTLDWQVQSTIDLANRSNVAIYIIDSSGLTGGTPQSGALVPSSALGGISAAVNQEDRIRAGAGESVFDISRQEGLNRQQDLLYRISGDTGGQFIKNSNDVKIGLERIDEEVRSRYTLAYRSTDENFNGDFRKVKIEVRRPDLKVTARPGYYAIPPTQIIPFSPEERKLLAGFDSASTHPTLPLYLQVVPFRTQPGFYTVPLSFEIPPTALEFVQRGTKQRLQLDVLGLVKNEGSDKVISRLGGNFDVELSPAQYASILNDKIFYRQDILLEAGSYDIELLVKDRVSGKAAAKKQSLKLPAMDAEFSSTEAVLSRHVDPVRQPQTGSADVFTIGNALIRPLPSREFQPADDLIIFFNLYNAIVSPETGKPHVRVTVTLMRDGKPAIKPVRYEVTELVAEPVPHLSFAKFIKLAGLNPGKYSALIEATDEVSKKPLKQEVAFAIAQ